MAKELSYELRSDGVLYRLSNDVHVLVKRRSPTRACVEIWRGEVLVPPETGNLGTGKFRSDLFGLACERFGEGEVESLAEELGLIAVAFDGHVLEREEAAAEDDLRTNDPALRGTPFCIVDGGLARLKQTPEGEVAQRITNFVARVEEEVVKDDGAETRRVYRLVGETKDRSLPAVEVPAGRFGGMGWLAELWGLAARISAGAGVREYVREAIEALSYGCPVRRVYSHTGWRTLPDGKRVYLHAAGAIGAVDVEVELESELERYALPSAPGTPEELAEAVRKSWGFLSLAPLRVTAPLLGAAYSAPLSGIIVPDFLLWLWAETGSYKSTLAALCLSHYGELFSEASLPLSYESTANALERFLFLLKDTLAVVDDRRPAVGRSDAAEMERKDQRLFRGVGNRQGRGRMTADTALRRSYAPRGLVVATAEALPEGPAFESVAARSLSVNLGREDVDLARLSELQRCKAELSRSMVGYLEWVAPRYEVLARRLPPHREALREEARRELTGSHPRTPGAVACLIAGLQTFRAYSVSVGALNPTEADELLERARAGVFEAARAHVVATGGGDPASRFVEILRSLFAADGVYVKDREYGTHPEDWAELGWERRTTAHDSADVAPQRGASFVGWVDEHFMYLEKDSAYAAVCGFAQRGGIPFGIKPRALWQALKRAGASLADEGRSDTLARIEGKPRRVVQINRTLLQEEGGLS